MLESSSGYLAFGTHVNLHKSLDKFAINPNHLPRFSFHKCQMHINDNPRALLTGVAGTPHRLRAGTLRGRAISDAGPVSVSVPVSVSGQHQRRANIEIENMTGRETPVGLIRLLDRGRSFGAQGSGALPASSACLPANIVNAV